MPYFPAENPLIRYEGEIAPEIDPETWKIDLEVRGPVFQKAV